MFRIKLYIGENEDTERTNHIYILGDWETRGEAEKEIDWICERDIDEYTRFEIDVKWQVCFSYN